MRNSIVNIESVSNNSFGTGFVIDSDEKGVYILTCQHVIDDVETPVVENVLAKVIAKGGFIDMAVLYVSKLHLKPLSLQTQECDELDVEVIGFSHFSKSLTQKKHIKATLYKELIELHSKEEDAYYNVRKIKANDGFNFDRGNSGSPVICKSSGNVIAMISNKEGNDIGYAIDIINLKGIWKDAPSKLFEKPRAIIEPISGTKDDAPQQKETIAIPTTQNTSSSSIKYFIIFAIFLGVGFGVYSTLVPKSPTKEERLAQERKVKDAEEKYQQETLNKTLKYEKDGFQALMNKNYNSALRSFSKANKLTPKFHHVSSITTLLKNNIKSMNQFITKRKVLNEILTKYSKYAPEGFTENIKKQIKIPIIKIPTKPILIKKPEIKIHKIENVKIRETPKLDLSRIKLKELEQNK